MSDDFSQRFRDAQDFKRRSRQHPDRTRESDGLRYFAFVSLIAGVTALVVALVWVLLP